RRFAHQQANRLAFDRNTLSFTFEANNYRFAFPKIRCQLVGLDSDWVHPPHNSIQYTNLSPGDYAFQVQARHREEPWGNVEEVRFHIETPFWQTWWFYTLCVLAGILVIGSAVSWWYRSKQARLTQEVDRLKAEQKALQSQMNPHFVYNALNSAQKFLMLGKTQELDDFMGRLAQLMRAGLENSRVAFIPLKEEMEFIHNYLRIETQRFPERFQFNIEIEPQLEEALGDAYIPPLMIQPLCENAIKHAYADQQVTISVTVTFAGEAAIEVQVMDDGIGLQTREKRASQHASSLGVSILSERIELLKKQGYEASFYVASGVTNGTVATLILPTQ
ncbi:MAG: histidine kinase, partial [Bacteroidota bacterium]